MSAAANTSYWRRSRYHYHPQRQLYGPVSAPSSRRTINFCYVFIIITSIGSFLIMLQPLGYRSQVTLDYALLDFLTAVKTTPTTTTTDIMAKFKFADIPVIESDVDDDQLVQLGALYHRNAIWIHRKLNLHCARRLPDSIEFDNIQLLQQRRRSYQHSLCPFKKRPESIKYLSKILVDQRHRTLFCVVPRSRSLDWIRAFLVLATNETYVNSLPVGTKYTVGLLRSHGLRALGDYDVLERRAYINEYFKVMFVQHPIVRVLLHAHQNTVAQDDGNRYRNYVKPSVKYPYLRYNREYYYAAMHYLNNMTAFKPLPSDLDLVDNICQPCMIKYDFIGKMETFETDAGFVLDKLVNRDIQKSNVCPPAMPNTTSVDSGVVKDLQVLWSLLPASLKERFHETYNMEAMMFDYEW